VLNARSFDYMALYNFDYYYHQGQIQNIESSWGGGLMSSTKDARIEAPSGVWAGALPIRGGVVLKNFTSPTSVANYAQ